MKTEHVIDYGPCYDRHGFDWERVQTTTTADTCSVVTLIAPKMTRKERAVWRIKRQRFY